MNKINKKIIFIPIIVLLLAAVFFLHAQKSNTESEFDKIISGPEYANLSENVISFLREYYEANGEVLKTEETAEPGENYITDAFSQYLDLPKEEQEKADNVPIAISSYSMSPTEVSGATLPSSYDLRPGYVSTIKPNTDSKQNWLYGLTGVAESYAYKQYEGAYVPGSSTLLSAKQLDYVTATNSIINYTSEYIYGSGRNIGDISTCYTGHPSDCNFNTGIFAMAAGVTLYRDDHFTSTGNAKKELKDVLSYSESLYEVNETKQMPTNTLRKSTDTLTAAQDAQRTANLNQIKEHIMEKGAAYVITYPTSACSLDGGGFIDVYNCGTYSGSGQVMEIVGWDDTYTRQYCAASTTHTSTVSGCSQIVTINGAWILQNTMSNGKNYPYLAYDSMSTEVYLISDMTTRASKNWTNSYVVGDNSSKSVTYTYSLSGTKIRNTEILKKIKFFAQNTNQTYSIYINGTKVREESFDTPGLKTISFGGSPLEINSSTKITITVDHGTYHGKVLILTDNKDNTPYLYHTNRTITLNTTQTYFFANTKNIPSGDAIYYKLYDTSNNEISQNIQFDNNYIAENNIQTIMNMDENLLSGKYRLDATYKDTVLDSVTINYQAAENVGTPENPYQIKTATDLYNIRNNPSAYYELANDIDLTYETRAGGLYYNTASLLLGGHGWEPIPTFNGNLNGNGHTIKGLYQKTYLENGSNNSVRFNGIGGLFKTLQDDATITNLVLDSFDITCHESCGILANEYVTTNSSAHTLTLDKIAVKNSVIKSTTTTINPQPTIAGIINNVKGTNANTTVNANNIYIDSEVTPEYNGAGIFFKVTAKKMDLTNVEYNGKLNGRFETNTAGIVYDLSVNEVNIENILSTVGDNKVGALVVYQMNYEYNTVFNLKHIKFINNVTKPYVKNTVAGHSAVTTDVNHYNTFNDIAQATNPSNYSGWTNYSTNWVAETIEGVPRLPRLKFVNFEYSKINLDKIDLDIDSTDTYNLYDNVTPNNSASKNYAFIVANTTKTIATMESTGVIKPNKVGKTTVNLVSLYDGASTPAMPIHVVPLTTKYEFTFEANGAEGTMDSEQVLYGNNDYKLPELTFTKDYYHFKGWNTKANGTGKSFTNEETIDFDEFEDYQTAPYKVTLYAIWEANIYTVNFNGNGGTTTNPMGTQGFVADVPQALNANTYNKLGYLFDTWNTSADGTGNSFEDREVVVNITKVNNDNFTLYARWKPITYKVKFHGNGGSYVDTTLAMIITETEQTHTYDKDLKLAANPFKKTGYKFMGWSLSSTSSTITYADEQSIINQKNTQDAILDVYAVWAPINYSYAFDPNTGEGTMTNQTYTYDEAQNLKPNTFTKLGYTFDHWNTKANGTGESFTNEQELINKETEDNKIVTLYAIWEANEYKVRFNGNGGSATVAAGTVTELEQTHTYDTAKNLDKNEFKRTGYTFLGWSLASDDNTVKYADEEEVINLRSEAGDVINLFAVWKANKYTVKFDANTGVGEMEDQLFTYDEAQLLRAYDFTKTGYLFQGWNTDKDATTALYADKQSVSNLRSGVDDEITLYAIWKPINYTVKFNANTGTGDMEDQIYTYDKVETGLEGVKISKSEFTKTGYLFQGWNTDKDAEEPLYTDEQPIKNITTTHMDTITFYAIWKPVTYEVIFDANTGTGTMENQTLTYDKEEPLRQNTISKTGYLFQGWNTDKDAEEPLYTDEQPVVNLKENQDDKITLYAIWKPIKYTIKFNANNGTGEMEDQEFTYDYKDAGLEGVKLTKNTFTRVGYIFRGWNTIKDAENPKYSDETVIFNLSETDGEEIIFYAIWQPITYKVIYNANTGTGTMEDQTLTYDKPENLRENEFEKVGYNFIGWDADPAAEEPSYTLEHTVQNLRNTQDAEITLYAIWQPITYTFSFDPNSGIGEMEKQHFTYDEPQDLNANLFSKKGYHFAKWTRNADGSGKSYTDKQEILNDTTTDKEEITIYAQWEPNEYTIIFDTNKGEGSIDPQKIKYDQKEEGLEGVKLTKNTFTRVGYLFQGWNTDKDSKEVEFADEAVIFNLTDEDGKEITFYAIWKPIEYDVIFDNNNGTGEMEKQHFVYDAPENLHKNTFTRVGYLFQGWNIDSDSKEVEFADVAEINNITTNNNDEITFYAVWKPITYHIIFNNNTGSGTMATQDYTYDEPQKLHKNEFTKTGYTFVKWNTQSDGSGIDYSDCQELNNLTATNEANITLYAVWEANTYKVKFEKTSGEGEMTEQVFKYDESKRLSANAFTKKGYLFAGWSINEDSNEIKYTNEEVVTNLRENDNDEITLYAIWKPIKYTIRFNANNGTGEMEPQVFTYDEAQKLTANTFTRLNFTFQGWSTNPADANVIYQNEKELLNLTDEDSKVIDIYAVWKADFIYKTNQYAVNEDKKYIDTIRYNTTVDDFKKGFTLNDGFRIEVDLGGNAYIYTGSKTRIYDGDKLVSEYTNIVKGDINGDGKISALDYVKIRNHIMGNAIIGSEIEQLASDVNIDGKISALDYIAIKNIIMGR